MVWRTALAACFVLFAAVPTAAQETPTPASEPQDSRGVQVAKFLGGAAVGFGAHELAHLLADAACGADVSVKKVDFHGIPFFAIAHSPDVSPRQEYVISSAGFWMQHATSEWILSAHPNIRGEARPFEKGMLAFNVFTSIGYASVAFFETGPAERDTRSMASSLGVSERWVAVMILAPAVLDAIRYFHPHAGWAKWSSRGVKIGLVVLTLK